jgi:hypothetical protein
LVQIWSRPVMLPLCSRGCSLLWLRIDHVDNELSSPDQVMLFGSTMMGRLVSWRYGKDSGELLATVDSTAHPCPRGVAARQAVHHPNRSPTPRRPRTSDRPAPVLEAALPDGDIDPEHVDAIVTILGDGARPTGQARPATARQRYGRRRRVTTARMACGRNRRTVTKRGSACAQRCQRLIHRELYSSA